MAYNITEGWYKLYYEFSIDGGNTYPYNTSLIAPLSISDVDFGTTNFNIAADSAITEKGQSFVNESKISGLVNNITLGISFTSNFPADDYNEYKIKKINEAGVIGVSLSLPDYNEYIGGSYSDIYYKVYIESTTGKVLLYSGTVRYGRVSVGYVAGASLQYDSADYLFYVHIPVFLVNTEKTILREYKINFGSTKIYYEGYIDRSSELYKFDGLEPYVEDTDPYSKGGDTETGGGTGDFDGTSDDIPIPDLPTLSATSTNFITLFNPSLGELQNLANYMWSDLFDLDTFKKIFADPMDCILGLSIVPVAVPSGGSKAVTVGNISTGVTMQVASAQYVSVDCGTLNVNEYWGAYLDYDPYTKAEIYLPYIGTHPIAVDDIMGKAVHVVYHVDILSGACTAYVQCGGSVLYSFIGQCSASIPITGNDWTNVINGVLSIAGSIGSMVATGGMSAPLTALQAPVTTAKVGGALATGSSLASTAINSMKPSVEKSGSMSGVGGMLAVQTPYIILTRPRQARPKQQNTYTGYPSFITSKLSKLTGYTEIEVIHIDGLSCTDSESVEIESLLKSGVIF